MEDLNLIDPTQIAPEEWRVVQRYACIKGFDWDEAAAELRVITEHRRDEVQSANSAEVIPLFGGAENTTTNEIVTDEIVQRQ